uniref:Coiled-coil domain containing 60 n=1 Tax=Pseudonaja textilis TaxID=8673 RepID=A0A670ZVU0_PSETE
MTNPPLIFWGGSPSNTGMVTIEPVASTFRLVSHLILFRRHLINSVKIGRGYFHSLRRESIKRRNVSSLEQRKEAEKRRMEFQPPRGFLVSETEKKKKKKMARPFTPIHYGLLSQKHPEAHFDSIFRQLCALNWLLEALTLDPSSSMKPLITCWNPKRYTQKQIRGTSSKKSPKMTGSMSKISGLSSPHSKTTLASTSSLTPGSDEVAQPTSESVKEVEEMESSYSKQTKEEEEPLSYCEPLAGSRLVQGTPLKVYGDSPSSKSLVVPKGASFFQEAAGLCGFSLKTCLPPAIYEWVGLFFSCLVFSFFPRFSTLLERIPDEIRRDRRTQKVLKKLERFARNPDLRIRPPTFLKVLGELRIWEICSPDICAAVEFLREYIVDMPEDDYKQWLQARVPFPKRVHSAPPL